MKVLENLKPNKVFTFFEELTTIPHGSGNEQQISDYLVNFAKKRNLDVIQDKSLNVIIKKPGTPGYENAPTVIIQGHMDMVCDKTTNCDIDFSKDPLKLRIDGDYIYATDTTLGADDGIAVAYGLALLDSNDIPHPPIEFLVTTSEETGMFGAEALDAKNLKGKILINIDSEEEGIFLVGCAGGINTETKLQLNWEEAESRSIKLVISNLNGGHSGQEINKGRANANKLMGRLLYTLSKETGFNLVSVNGGTKDNAITRECSAVITVAEIDIPKVQDICLELQNTLRHEFKVEDPNITILATDGPITEKQLTDECTKNIISFLLVVPYGVQTMSKDIPGLVESSLNLGIVKTTNEAVECTCSIRSSVKSIKYAIADEVEALTRLTNGTVIRDTPYPAWQYEEHSKIRDLCKETYNELYGKEPEISAIHAGLECGLLKEKMPDTDMISFGPNIYDAHTPNEHLSISSTQRVWDFLLALLKNIK